MIAFQDSGARCATPKRKCAATPSMQARRERLPLRCAKRRDASHFDGRF
ncbi:hypothetical protein DM52_1276 [Burkholderia mallei]|nr:hypothetical protein DM52_1276 [Burkholderia mallei]